MSNFDHLVFLFKTDRQAFEEVRSRLIGELLNSSHITNRKRAMVLQLELDMIRVNLSDSACMADLADRLTSNLVQLEISWQELSTILRKCEQPTLALIKT